MPGIFPALAKVAGFGVAQGAFVTFDRDFNLGCHINRHYGVFTKSPEIRYSGVGTIRRTLTYSSTKPFSSHIVAGTG